MLSTYTGGGEMCHEAFATTQPTCSHTSPSGFVVTEQTYAGILGLQTGMASTLPALEGEVLTAGPPPHPPPGQVSILSVFK